MLSSVLSSVQDWLRELHIIHTENLYYSKKVEELTHQVSELKDKNRSLEKTCSLLNDSLKLLNCTNEAMLEPIKFEMEFIAKLE